MAILFKVGYVGDPINLDQSADGGKTVVQEHVFENAAEGFDTFEDYLAAEEQHLAKHLTKSIDVLNGLKRPDSNNGWEVAIQVYREWVMHEMDRFASIAEIGNLIDLRKVQTRVQEVLIAVQATLYGLSRARLPLQALPPIRQEVSEHLNAFDRINKLIATRIDILSASAPAQITSKKQVKLTYKWLFSDLERKELFNKMKGVWIGLDTHLEEFTQIFNAQPIDKIRPISWLGSTSSLIYFIIKIQELGMVEKNKRKTNDYKKMDACFKGPRLGKSHAQLAGKLDTMSVESTNAIDQLLDSCL